MTTKKIQRNLLIALGAVVISFATVLLSTYAFQEPTALPPGDNAPAPINVSDSAQTKLGILALPQLLTGVLCLGDDCRTGWPFVGDSDWIISGVNMYSGVSGKVGIGATDPVSKLDVRGNISLDRDRFIYFGLEGITGEYIRENPSGTIEITSGFQRKIVAPNNGKLYIMPDGGNVGIGTTDPGARLDIQGALQVGGGDLDIDSTAGDNFILRTKTNTPNPNFTIGIGNGAGGWSHYPIVWNNFLDFRGSGTAEPAHMRITNTGNVGIGTISPSQKLDVAGYVKGSGLCIGGDCRTSWPTSDFNPNGSYPNLTAGNANTANYANSAGTANTLQGYLPTSPGGSGTNQVPVTDSGGRLSSSVMPAGIVSNACNFFPPSTNCPSGTYQHSSWNKNNYLPYTSDFQLDVLNSRPDLPKTADQCNLVKTCLDRGGSVEVKGSLSYDPYSRDDYYNPRNNCVYVPPSHTRWEGKWSGAWQCFIPLKLCCPNP